MQIGEFLRRKNPSIVISYLELRRLIGILGMLLPFACVIGGRLFAGFVVQPSISAYYYTNMQDVFVGLLAGVAMFLLTYKGYELIDTIAMIVTGIGGLGVATFPCVEPGGGSGLVGVFQLPSSVSNIFHVTSAGIFFALLAFNSIFLFTRSDQPKELRSREKNWRNTVYLVCGLIILLCLIALVILHILYSQGVLDESIIVLIIETIMLEAFGVSWLVKGGTLFKDKAADTATA